MKAYRNIMRCIIPVLTLALMLQAAPLALAANPADNSKHLKSLPSDSFGILHINDLPKTISDLEDNILYKSFVSALESEAFQQAMEENEDIAAFKEFALLLIKEVPKALTGEFTFAVPSIDEENNQPNIIILADADEEKFENLINNVLSQVILSLEGPKIVIDKSGELNKIGPKDARNPLLYSVENGLMVLSPFEHSFASVKNVTESLADNPLFKSTFEKHADSPDSLFFINLRKIFETTGVNQFAPLKLIGISSIAGFGSSNKSTADGAISETTFHTPDGLTGFLSILSNRGSGPGFEKYVPEDYSAFIKLSVGSFDGLYKDIIAFLEENDQFGEEAIEGFNGMLEEVGNQLGFSITEDLLPNLGGEIGFAAKAPKVIGIPEMAAFLEIKDREKIQNILDGILAQLAREIPFVTSEYKGIEIKSTHAAIVQPCFAFVGNYLVAAISPAVMQDIIDSRASGLSLLNNPDYKTVFSNLPEKGFLTLYIDTKEIFAPLVPLILSVTHRDRDMYQFLAPGLVSLQMNMQEVPGWGIVFGADENSIQIKGFCGMGSVDSVLPMAAGILLPTMSHSREQARRVHSMSNLKQLCIAQKMYALDHDEIYAEKFSELYPDYIGGFGVFQHSGSGTERITSEEDIDELADYVIVKGLTETVPSDYILLYEKEQFSEGGRNVAHVDGSAMWMTEDDFQEKLKEQLEEMKQE